MWSVFGYQAARIALVTKLPMDSSVAAPLQVTFTPVTCFSGARLVSSRRREPIVREQFGALERVPPQQDRSPQSLQIRELCRALRPCS
jgi:hypothetical protein